MNNSNNDNWATGMKVLVVDDDKMNAAVIKDWLEKSGYEVETAFDGLQAVKMLQSPNAPRLVVLDWIMPNMNGLEVCRMMRESHCLDSYSELRYPYIIMLTAKDDIQDMVAGFDAGVDDYMKKPVNLEELRLRLQAGIRILKLQDKLQDMATKDSLTGLYNRETVLSQLKSEVCRAQRGVTNLAVAILDLDHFKVVNDTYGHAAGDLVLRETACRINSALRPYDVVGRLGGEEFLIIIPGAEEAAAKIVCERICKGISETPIKLPSESIRVTASLGLTNFKGEESLDRLLEQADYALYNAKRTGRNCVRVFTKCDANKVAANFQFNLINK